MIEFINGKACLKVGNKVYVLGGASSWNELTDKPFYENVQNLGDTLTWDGTPNEDVVTMPTGTGTESITFYRISENVPTDEELMTSNIVLQHAGQSFEVSSDHYHLSNPIPVVTFVMAQVSDDVVLPAFVVLRVDDYRIEDDYMSLHIEKKGVYSVGSIMVNEVDNGEEVTYEEKVFVSSLTIPNYNFTKTEIKKLDPKYLPDGGFGYTVKESMKDTLTWDGTPTGVAASYFTATFARVSSNVPSAEELVGGIIGYSYAGETKTREITSEAINEVSNDIIVIKSETGLMDELPIIIVVSKDGASFSEIVFPKKGIYFINSPYETVIMTTSLTIPDYTFTKEVVHKIDEKYLPDHLPVVELTTPLTFRERISLTQEEGTALTKVAGAGSPVILKGVFADLPFVAVASTVPDNTIAVSFDTNYIVLTSDDNGDWSAWAYFIDVDQINLTNEIASQNQSDLANLTELHNDLEEDFIALRDSIPQATASDNGKFLQVVDGAYALVSLKELGEEGM